MTAVDVDQDLAERVLADLENHGYAVVESLLPVDRVDAIREELHSILSATPTGRNDFEGFQTRRIYALFAKTRVFDDLAVHPLLLTVLDAVLGSSYHLSAPTGIEIAPGERAQFLHTDDAIYPLPRPHNDVVLNSMWAFDDFTTDNGATRVVPGSHRWTDRQPVDPDETVTVTMPAGSVLFLRGTLWHGGGANQTDRPRLGVLLEYVAGWLRQQENHILAVPTNVVRILPPRLQELLGYNIHPPFVGYVDGRHPRRLLEDGA
ncbi:MAG: phytanoyl-CoA dioxygenase family protein [Frankiaceae bacterium]|nr:phytanoyl-CoA dioxygenase family protein [Frankiaceae bacterium]MBV9870761.1 phytanoyl-CoA dioxygenase family protein [Frankiaceae bacterium]